ncbi:MAG: 30S ribosomal protein S4 [Candidatus Bathyarchaeota archaeon]|nr:MAG: 30S ribosomal protein S4 [Candidatus Bathyarchaeota archaeon]
MGDPKRPRKKFETPRFPWRGDRLESELQVFGGYGLRNKRELWRNYASLSKYRKTARSLLTAPSEQRLKLERDLLGGLYRLGVLDEGATIDDVLNLRVENLLDRRLQTLVHRLGFSVTPWQARQLIVHGHISVDGRRVSSPSYMVRRGEEEKIRYSGQSPISDPKHVLRENIGSPTVKSGLKPGPIKSDEKD